MSRIHDSGQPKFSLKLSLAFVAMIIGSAVISGALNWQWLGQLEANGDFTGSRAPMVWQTICTALFFSGAGLFAARMFAGPIQELADLVSTSKSTKDLAANTKGEVHVIASAFQDIQARAANVERVDGERDQAIAELSKALDALKTGDLKYRVTGDLADEYRPLKTQFNETAGELEAFLGSVSSHAAQIQTSAYNISESAGQLSQRTENQAATLEESSAAIEQLAEGVTATAGSAKHADQLVGSTKSSAEASGLVMDQAVEAMKNIETSSTQISQVVGVIDDIAFQTNLLALNASVEAARAGDAGRGFAVVASEVRALAQRSSDAAKEIETLMSESHGHVTHGVQHVQKAVDTLRNIASSVTEISTAVSAIASTAQEQSLGISEINSAIANLDQGTQQTAAMISASATAGTDLSKQAEELDRYVRGMGGQVAMSAPVRSAPEPTFVAPAPAPVTPAVKPAITTDLSNAPEAAANPVAEQQEKLARYVAGDGNAALELTDPDDSDWIEF